MKSPISRGPQTGYTFGNKKQYRRTLWNFIDSCMDIPNRDRTVFYLDTKDGFETEFLLARGYRSANLHVINWNPAEVAVLSRRLADRNIKINTHGIEAFEAIRRFKGRVDVVNLDLCGAMSEQLVHEMCELSTRINEAVISVSMLRGREGGKFLSHLRNIKIVANEDDYSAELAHGFLTSNSSGESGVQPGDLLRLMSVRLSLMGVPNGKREQVNMPLNCRWGIYKSSAGTQTMLWCASHLLRVNPQSHRNMLFADIALTFSNIAQARRSATSPEQKAAIEYQAKHAFESLEMARRNL